jgi:hypothetical protein
VLRFTGCGSALPSVIVPEAFNFVFNPSHRAAAQVRLGYSRDFPFDVRLV